MDSNNTIPHCVLGIGVFWMNYGAAAWKAERLMMSDRLRDTQRVMDSWWLLIGYPLQRSKAT